jgi:hypothetical protein
MRVEAEWNREPQDIITAPDFAGPGSRPGYI